jgi:hypothetical protein
MERVDGGVGGEGLPQKVLVCAMNDEGRVVASIRVDPVADQVETARNVMLAVSPVVQDHLVTPQPRP